MFITKYFLIGKVSIVSSWVALIISFIVAYLIVRWKYGKSSANLLGDAIFYFIIVWKFSVIVTDFETVLQFPWSIIYFNGGTTGVFLGIGAATVKVFVEMNNKRLLNGHIMGLLLGGIMIQSMYQILIVLFNEGPFTIGLITVMIFSIFGLGVLLFMDRFKEMPNQLILLMIGVHLFVSALQPMGLFQTPMFVAIAFGVVMAIMNYLALKESRNAHFKT